MNSFLLTIVLFSFSTFAFSEIKVPAMTIEESCVVTKNGGLQVFIKAPSVKVLVIQKNGKADIGFEETRSLIHITCNNEGWCSWAEFSQNLDGTPTGMPFTALALPYKKTGSVFEIEQNKASFDTKTWTLTKHWAEIGTKTTKCTGFIKDFTQ
jgi:hypothetical protein